MQRMGGAFCELCSHLERTPGKRLCEEKAVAITEPAGSFKLRFLASKAAMNKLLYVFKKLYQMMCYRVLPNCMQKIT